MIHSGPVVCYIKLSSAAWRFSLSSWYHLSKCVTFPAVSSAGRMASCLIPTCAFAGKMVSTLRVSSSWKLLSALKCSYFSFLSCFLLLNSCTRLLLRLGLLVHSATCCLMLLFCSLFDPLNWVGSLRGQILCLMGGYGCKE